MVAMGLLVLCRDVPMGGVAPPTIMSICKKVGRKAAMLQES